MLPRELLGLGPMILEDDGHPNATAIQSPWAGCCLRAKAEKLHATA